MKRLFAALLAACLLALGLSGLTGCAKKETEKTFTVGFDQEFPPYGYVNDAGEYEGFDLDLAKEVCKRNNWKIVLKAIDWNSKDMLLSSGTIDCIWNGFTINGREDDYTWSEPYVDNSQVIVVKKNASITDFAGLSGKVVAVQKASSALEALSNEEDTKMVALKASFKQLKEMADYNTAFLNLEQGSVDAVAMDIGVAKYQIASRGDAYVMLTEQISTEKYGIGFKKGNTQLRDAVQKTINEMAKDGTFTKIAAKYEKYGLPDAVLLGK